jgi:hypothetical protein
MPMCNTESAVRFEPVETVPESASVCHYDELAESLQVALAEASGPLRTTTTVDDDGARCVDQCGCDVVRFLEYYRVAPA